MPAKRPPNVVTELPSGTKVEYWDEVGVDGLPQQRRYAPDGTKAVSISTVANVYEKPALPGWAANTTVEGVARLLEFWPADRLVTPDDFKRALRDQGLDADSVRDEAARRGDVCHGAMLAMLRDGTIPSLGDFEPRDRPWIRAGAKFVLEEEPVTIDCEVIVASVEHGFAGRYDWFGVLPKRGGRKFRLDYKTVTSWSYGKARQDGTADLLPPYPEHLSQVEGYELGARESGMEASDARGVVRLGPDGEYDLCESWATAENFLGDLAAYRNRQALNAAGTARRKAERVAAQQAELEAVPA